MARLLAHIRLSDLTDETTSPERQKKEIEGYARRDDTIVAWTEDLDVSGSITRETRGGTMRCPPTG